MAYGNPSLQLPKNEENPIESHTAQAESKSGKDSRRDALSGIQDDIRANRVPVHSKADHMTSPKYHPLPAYGDRQDRRLPKRTEMLQEAFIMVDLNRDGVIDMDELSFVCKAFDGNNEDGRIEELLQMFGAADAEYITEAQWVQLLSHAFRDKDDHAFEQHLRYLSLKIAMCQPQSVTAGRSLAADCHSTHD